MADPQLPAYLTPSGEVTTDPAHADPRDPAPIGHVADIVPGRVTIQPGRGFVTKWVPVVRIDPSMSPGTWRLEP